MPAAIHIQHALPNDPDIDALDSGVAEVDHYFQRRVWFDDRKGKASPATYQFRTRPGGAIVGYAATTMDALEELARDRADCVGLSLWGREDNPRAVAFYERCGFVADPAGPVARDEGPRHLTMRLLFGS